MQFLESSEELFLLLAEGGMHQEQLEGTGAVYSLGLTLHLGQGQVGVDDHLSQQIHLFCHGADLGSHPGVDFREGVLEFAEEAGLVVGDGCDLLNFYFFILLFLEEGEVERLIGCVDVGVDEAAVSDHFDQKVLMRVPPEGLLHGLDIFRREIGDDGDCEVATDGHVEGSKVCAKGLLFCYHAAQFNCNYYNP